MKPQLPAQHTLSLVAYELDVPGDAARGVLPLVGESFELVVGTLTLMSPARLAHTAILCLAGEVGFAGGTLLTGDGVHQQPFGSGAWKLVVADSAHNSRLRVNEYLQEHGPAHRHVGQRLGLDSVGEVPVDTLGWATGLLLGVAVAVSQDPDVVAVDLLDTELSGVELHTVVGALRDVVDVEGRTVVLAGDFNAVPVELQATFDQVVELGHSLSGREPVGC